MPDLAAKDLAAVNTQGLAPSAGPGTYAACVLIVLVFLTADILLPRGATAAIGYCLIPLIAANGRRWFLLSITSLCTILTVVGYFFERPPLDPSLGVFDRTMVAGVLWLTFALTNRRRAYLRSMASQVDQLTKTGNELVRSNGELQRFASVVAHDLRGPLTTMGLVTQLMSQSAVIKKDADSAESVESIRMELKRMEEFIEELLTYGRAGASELHLADCDCAVVVADVCRRLKASLDLCNGEVITEALPILRADPTLLGELFQNLIENSIKYRCDAAPTIRILVERQNDKWLFRVRDNGIGVSDQDAQRIFEPFFQNQAGQSASVAGVGLGLATCKRIVERHGGRIWAQSCPGEGATFLFTIPCPAAGS